MENINHAKDGENMNQLQVDTEKSTLLSTNVREGTLSRQDRKKILLLSDDC